MISDLTVPFQNYVNSILARKFGKKVILRNRFLGSKKFYCSSSVEVFRTIKYGGEESSLGAFVFLLQEDDIVWDIGTSIGLFTIHSAKHVKKVVSFEPDPAIYMRLQENIKLNDLNNKATAFQYAIGDREGKMTLNSDGIDGMSPSLQNLERHTKSVEVKVKSIDDLITSGFEIPTVLKIDIEGAEILALRGAKKLLSSASKPRLIFVEVHPNFLTSFDSNAKEAVDLIESNNYKILTTQQRGDQFHVIAVAN